MFEDFEHHRLTTATAEIDLVAAGEGFPVLLLHGFPQTRAAWHLVAPQLARHYRVIVPDLPGYGASRGPTPSADGATHSKRSMAAAMVEVMESLGHDEFAVAGHDRGGRVAYRMALDHPNRVNRLAVMDIMTTIDTWEEMDWKAALRSYHWPLLAQDAPVVERLLGADPGFYLDHLLNRWKGEGAELDPAAVAEYRAAMERPEVRAAMAADYRAGAGIDRELDEADRDARHFIACPMLLIRGRQYEPRSLLDAWTGWGEALAEEVFDCGHFLAEEKPEQTTAALAAFFGAV
ncbi:alpha/beta hydrolase [Halovulum dunhuangense]|uniref:Alpha/beta hydrolase n=1 Tax=Halovulum dunhuangense TaxID=1505036 RepID=A0A849KUD9_9RHOB|nr:alpha/beta hydrolase [Halovulum dunhuangense]NNU78898.1 alpha/beta hydrolase [Halovulum dunhuangense]